MHRAHHADGVTAHAAKLKAMGPRHTEDVLALGMLSCLRRAFDLLRDHHGLDLTPATIPPEDPVVNG